MRSSCWQMAPRGRRHERAVLPDRRSAHDPRSRAQGRPGTDRAARRPLRRNRVVSRRVHEGDSRIRAVRHLVPEQYGGTDMGCLALALVCEEIAWACAASATQYLDQPLGGLPILLAGTEAQKEKYLPRLEIGRASCRERV